MSLITWQLPYQEKSDHEKYKQNTRVMDELLIN